MRTQKDATFMNIPNLLTLFRIVLIPVFVVFYYLPGNWSNIAAAVIFLLAALTDWLDGYLARVLNQSSPFGAFLDPVADKLMVALVLFCWLVNKTCLILQCQRPSLSVVKSPCQHFENGWLSWVSVRA